MSIRSRAVAFALAALLAVAPSALADGISNGVGVSAGVLEVKVTVDFNAANTDTQIALPLPAGFTRYRFLGAQGGSVGDISGASASITTATYGFFTGAGGTGTAIVAAGTVITLNTSAESTNNNMQQFATFANAGTQSFNISPLFFRVGTAQGSAATATVTILYIPVS